MIEYITEEYDDHYEDKERTEEDYIEKLKKLDNDNTCLLNESLSSVLNSSDILWKECSGEEKEKLLKELNTQKLKTARDCYNIVKGGILERIISCLPKKYDKNINSEEISIILKKLIIICDKMFTSSLTDDEHLECESKLKSINGYEILFYCFNHYPEYLHRLYISVILSNFHCHIPLPKKYLIILMIIKESTYLKLNNKIPDDDILMIDLIRAMANISINSENCKYFFKLNFIPPIFDIIDKTERFNRENSILLLSNLCNSASTEEKEELLRKEIFSRLNPHLIRIINNLKKTIESSNEIENFKEIREWKWLCLAFANLLAYFLPRTEFYISSKYFDYFLEIFDILKEFSFDKPETAIFLMLLVLF